MQTIKKVYSPSDSGVASLQTCAISRDILFLDIKATGSSAEKDRIYLIGSAGCSDNWEITQWLDSTGEEETLLLKSLADLMLSYKVLIFYSADNSLFDFLQERMRRTGIYSGTKNLQLLNLFSRQKKLEKIAGISSGGRFAVEKYYGYARVGTLNEMSAADAYRSYLTTGSAEHLKAVLLLNVENLEGMIHLASPALYFHSAFRKVNVYKAQANQYEGYDGEPHQELLLYFHPDHDYGFPFRESVLLSLDGCFLKLDRENCMLKVPMVEGELKYFYENYQDYYYLPAQDRAIHKSIASFVQKDHRIQATASTCYIGKTGLFLPQWNDFETPCFRKNRKDRLMFFEFTETQKTDRRFFNRYAAYLCGKLV